MLARVVLMAAISIITAVTRPQFLLELYRSLRDQGDASWEWLVQLDGPAIASHDEMQKLFAEDDRVQVAANPRPLGSAVTRNLALLRARGSFLQCVDDDDLLCPGAVAGLMHALDNHAECFGAWGRSFTIENVDGPRTPFKNWPAAGVIPAGTVLDDFVTSRSLLVHVGSLLWRRSHLVAVGGYAALPRSIDTSPFLAAEARHPHFYADIDVYLYRLHGAQMTQELSYIAVRDQVHQFVIERANELRRDSHTTP